MKGIRSLSSLPGITNNQKKEYLHRICHLIQWQMMSVRGRIAAGNEKHWRGGDDRTRLNHDGSGRRRHCVRAPPSPVWVRHDDGSTEQVDRTPSNVILWDLDYPFPDDDEIGGDGLGHDYSHDSVESDDENNLVAVPPEGVEPEFASTLLWDAIDKHLRYRIRDLTVRELRRRRRYRLGRLPCCRCPLRGRRRGLQPDQEASRDARELRAQDGTDGERGGDESDDEIGAYLSQRVDQRHLEELFGTVLSNHGSLEEITISHSRIPIKYWTLFTESFLTSGWRLCRLSLESTPLTMEKCQLLKRMLQRKVRLAWLSLVNCGLGAEEWRTVCEGVAASGDQVATVTLEEVGVTVGPDTLMPLLRLPSAVDDLLVCASGWSDGAFEEFVKGLRTNECLVALSLRSEDNEYYSLHLVEELLTTYHCTLQEVTLDPFDDASQARINALLESNQRVRALGKPDSPTTFQRYHLLRKSAWPRVLEEYGRLPTQLYRFLRHGNLEGFALQVEDVSATAAARPRGRSGRRASFRSEATTTAALARPRDAKKKTKRRRKLFSK
jgi:hypothetical protein